MLIFLLNLILVAAAFFVILWALRQLMRPRDGRRSVLAAETGGGDAGTYGYGSDSGGHHGSSCDSSGSSDGGSADCGGADGGGGH